MRKRGKRVGDILDVAVVLEKKLAFGEMKQSTPIREWVAGHPQPLGAGSFRLS